MNTVKEHLVLFMLLATSATQEQTHRRNNRTSEICSPTWTEDPVQTEMHMSPGEDLELRCPAQGKPKPTIQWFKDGELVTQRFDNEPITMKGWRLFIPNVISTHDEGVYECVVKNKCGELRHSTQVFIQVRMNGPPVFFELPLNTSVTEGESAVITCRAYTDSITYTQWIKHDKVNGSHTDEQGQPHFHKLESQDNIFVNATHLIIFNTTLNDSGLYTCYIANQLGSIHYSSWISVLSPTVLPVADNGMSFIIVISVGSTLVIVLLMLSVCVLVTTRHPKQRVVYTNKVDLMASETEKSPKVDEVKHFVNKYCGLLPNSIRVCEPVGEGNFGIVHRGILNECSPVAVKMLKDCSSLAPNDVNDMMKEVELMKSLGCHRNVIQFIGTSYDATGCLQIVMEYAVHGNLRNFLRCHRPDRTTSPPRRRAVQLGYINSPQDVQHNTPLTRDQLDSFAFQIAQGMEYLASRKVIHRDLAARNVLVADGLVAKISDFGLTRQAIFSGAKDYYRKRSMLSARLPIKWMSPESLANNIYTTKSDVWSYGVLLWEIYTHGDNPYPSVPLATLYKTVANGYRMPQPDDASDEMYDVMKKCWDFEPDIRPTFTELVRFIAQIVPRQFLPESFDNFDESKLDSERLDYSYSSFRTSPTSNIYQVLDMSTSGSPTSHSTDYHKTLNLNEFLTAV